MSSSLNCRTAGLALAVVLVLSVLALSSTQQFNSSIQRGGSAAPLAVSPTLHILGVPTPQEMMTVVEGSPFTVPPNKIFVVTGASVQRYGSLQPWILEIRFNGQMVLAPTIDPNVSGVVQIPPGLTAPSGTTITTFESGNASALTISVVFGYLADA
jgi:hypothetical protein